MSRNKNIVFLNSKCLPSISEVGGKGYSLIKLSSLDLNVPNGIVLTVNFFNEWIYQIKSSTLYQQFLELLKKENNLDECSSILNQIKEWCLTNLVLTQENVRDIENSIKTIFPNEYNNILYAVRSSSPEEDLLGASFAGNYETNLGIKFNSIEKYILKSFISCLDFRVYKYKLEKGFNTTEIKIAIVIMKQINCDVSGVGFSINPVNNDFDEAVITSNFGLGESVVGGIVTPDEYILNKLSKKIISQKIGTKDKVVKLNDNKNETSILEQTEENKTQSSLNEEFLIKLVDSIITIENHYNTPIDIEFGIENNIIYILQARPITTFNKIPKLLATERKEQRQLYFDVTLAVQGFEKPVSTLGASIIRVFFHYMGKKILGSNHFDDIRKSAVDSIGGKMLLNISNILSKISLDTLAGISGNINNYLPEILSKYGENYKNEQVCYEINVRKLGMAWRLPIKRLIFYNFFASSTKKNLDNAYEKFINDNEIYVKNNLKSNVPVFKILEQMFDQYTTLCRDNFIPAMNLAVVRGYFKLNSIIDNNFKDKTPELKQDINNLTKCLPYVTILMGLDLYHLTKHLNKNDYRDKNKSQEEFYQDFLNKKFPKEFYKDYEIFMKKYGFRGEGELDIKNERYYENPKPILNQIYSSLMMYDDNNNPQKDYEDTNIQRPKIFKKLQDRLESPELKKEFESAFNYTINFLQYRESLKYYVIFIVSKIKEIILERSKILLEKNLIDHMDDIYKLKIENLSQILQNSENYTKEEVFKQIQKDNELYEIFNSWKRTSLLFDSRGRIFNSERKKNNNNKRNEFIGDTVSFGKIKGKAKVLNSVNEKEFIPGEILITKATDPGWTPLIINCGGIVLEVGGMLQHGALVSREFNKPCIVGIENVTQIVKDGEEVEVDAIEGILRLLEREE
ncbi:glutathione synthetase ATP-binding domain-like protein [Anaeromyces robustus]|uniref:Glutathione synthetase ATP-binding domain-like protein n=1 Tax=Anaeromyces robustus TaxID=1754192 RepID=A0A1Y1XDX8_9FUNG|nr:glutathione synthetase ATP-binding domain-like protein [Anaeromyces robustus]|eukprot:ORX83933.1 glutathione synthetase ATP-binding domain-like protein [Anaeromyces robustus]